MMLRDHRLSELLSLTPASRGKTKAGKQVQNKEHRSFGDLLDRTKTALVRQARAEQHANLVRHANSDQEADAGQQTGDLLLAASVNRPDRREQTEVEELPREVEEQIAQVPDLPRPDAAKLVDMVFGQIRSAVLHELPKREQLPGSVHKEGVESEPHPFVAKTLLPTHERKGNLSKNDSVESQVAHVAATALPEVAVRPAAVPKMVAPDTSPAEPTPAVKLESVVVTKIETVFVPLATSAGMMATGRSPMQVTTASAPASPIPLSVPLLEQTVVKTIEIRLQPEELGEVRLAIHLRGEELRLHVEVHTHEAHALLQRDKSALSQLLEKAGYDLSETAVTLTLRPDTPPVAATSSSNNDASAFHRSSGGSGETFHHQPGGQQSRQAARQPHHEEQDGRKPESQIPVAPRQAGGGGIYL